MLESVRKRDGAVVAWDAEKIKRAIGAALAETGEGQRDEHVPGMLARRVGHLLEDDDCPGVERVQDAVEKVLMMAGYLTTAKAYILYRDRRAQVRALADSVPGDARALAEASSSLFPNALSEFVYYRTYSRWVESLGRRETLVETAARYVRFMHERLGGALAPGEYQACEMAILRMEVMPSMRLLWSAGDAARASNVAAFNCSYTAPSCLQDFGEVLYILACGTGVGFSAESRNVQMLPVVKRCKAYCGTWPAHVVRDSKEGWADALVAGLEAWYAGEDLAFDYSQVRPEGARLRTMGGRSSGPRMLQELIAFARALVLRRQGRRLSNIDVHDLVCKIGECIVSGGVRRSALISLSDLDDEAMRDAKRGHFFHEHGHRQLANNSVAYEGKPRASDFMREWLALAESGSGERGIFNRGGLAGQVPYRRLEAWAEMGVGAFETSDCSVDGFRLLEQVGTNPCGEINLLPKQFCNLTEVVCREGDTLEDLARKARVASILGTYQSTLTDFPYLSQKWRENCESERLLGVSLTGQWDSKAIMADKDGYLVGLLRREAVRVNEEYAARMNIRPSTAVTCGKPSGTVSQFVDAASGGHPRFAPFYIRRVRISATDPLFRALRDQGVPHEPENGQTRADANTFVFSFPCRAPAGARCAADVLALDQLEHWLRMKVSFTEHNPSVTIYVGPDEWVDVGHWVWQHWEMIGGLSFMPRSEHVYQQAPYEEIDEAQYDALMAAPRVDYSMVMAYERDDEGQGSKELACAAGACEI